MKIFNREEFDASQPAIDTPCDICGAIYDRNDCATASSGQTLCPDCKLENLRSHSFLPDFKIQSN